MTCTALTGTRLFFHRQGFDKGQLPPPVATSRSWLDLGAAGGGAGDAALTSRRASHSGGEVRRTACASAAQPCRTAAWGGGEAPA